MEYKWVRHIPTQCCYKLMEDGKTIDMCGCIIQPEIDGKIFWEYVDRYIEKPKPTPVDPFARH